MLTPVQYTVLKQELVQDTLTYGYATFITSGNDVALADLLNKLRDGSDGETAISIRRGDISPQEILEAIDNRDFLATPASILNMTMAASWFESITQARTIRLATDAGADSRVKNNIDRMLGNTNGTQTRLNALAVRLGSRAEQLFGAGTVLSTADIAIGRNS